MRALTLNGPEAVSVRDLPDPVVQEPTDAVVRVEAAGLCGSDLHPYLAREPVRWGVVPGHEVVGEVVDIGRSVTRVAVGDRVVVPFSTSCGRCKPCTRQLSARCVHGQLFGWSDPSASAEDGQRPPLDGGQAELVRVPLADGTLVGIPAELEAGAAILLADNLPTGWYAARRAGVTGATESVLVVGAGSVGICSAVAARLLGASRVLVTDRDPGRLAHAASALAEFGVTGIDPADTPGLAVDAAIDAAGPVQAQGLAAGAVAPGGTVSIIAVQTAAAFGIAPVLAYDRNLTIRTGRAPVRTLLEEVAPLVLDGTLPVPVAAIITHPGLPLTEGPEAYRTFAARKAGMVKATFTPRQGPS